MLGTEQGPGAVCQCELREGLEAGYVMLQRPAELRPFLANFFVCEDFTVPDKIGGCAEPASYAHAVLVCEGICGAQAGSQWRSAKAARLFVLEAEAEPGQRELAVLLEV